MDKLFLLDASGYLYRSYFAIRQMTNAKGESTNALFGFIRSVLKLIKEFDPSYMVSVFDGPSNAIARTAIYADYKAHRQEMPKDLLHQIEWAQQFCRMNGIPQLMIPEVEADDTMGSVALWWAEQGGNAYICTSDKDMCQLVGDHIFVLNPFKENQILGSSDVKKQFGVEPCQMVDYLAITGDASDNVPGLSGFGPKTASDLLEKFGTLDYILDHPHEIPGKKKQETVLIERDKALLSRRLVTINSQVPFEKNPAFFKLNAPSLEPLREFYGYMNFSSLLRELESHAGAHQKTALQDEQLSYSLVDNLNDLKALVEDLAQHPCICIDTETTNIHPMRAKLVGIGLGVRPGKAWYIPLNGSLAKEEVLNHLKPLLESPRTSFFGHNIKYDFHILRNEDVCLRNIGFDTMLASYLLNSHSRQHSLDHLSLECFGKVKTSIQELIGKGKNQIGMEQVPLDKVTAYCCEDVDYTIRLKDLLAPQLEERGLQSLFQNIELPLLSILAKMERHGIYIDTEILKHLSIEISYEIGKIAEEITALAGEAFNLNSPKQLSRILFEKLGIKPPKKTATGFSTNADVLESLKNDYPIAAKLLEYRSMEKLRSTYIDTLPMEVDPHTNRIHCTFNQSVAATGRLASQNPNLQNIPIRTEQGRKIREAFRPQLPGWSYLSADYSQIELRLLAHLSNDPILLEAFRTNEDIHAFTASQIFDIPIGEVTKEQRHQAKTVNFGLMYGQQAYGLSQELGIPPKTASAFIHMYFERYRKVKDFFEECKVQARETGKAVTLLGRERLIPEINSQNVNIRLMAERLAVNTPIQGTQADLIKMAMLAIDRQIDEKKLQAYMILQIHDELLFEVPDEELEEVQILVHDAMAKVMPLKIPLVVDMNVGKNWKQC